MKNFLRFSQTITALTEAESIWLMNYVENRHRGCDVNGNDREFEDDGMYPDFGFQLRVDTSTNQYTAWFYADKSGSVAQVAETVQDFLKEHRPKDCFYMTWADYAEELVVGQFDGGAVFVTAEDIETFHATEWVLRKEAGFSAQAEAPTSRALR